MTSITFSLVIFSWVTFSDNKRPSSVVNINTKSTWIITYNNDITIVVHTKYIGSGIE